MSNRLIIDDSSSDKKLQSTVVNVKRVAEFQDDIQGRFCHLSVEGKGQNICWLCMLKSNDTYHGVVNYFSP